MPDDTGLALRLQDAFVTLGGRAILEGISLEVARGTILAVTGPNGAGKTTLLDLVAGEVPGTGAVEIDAPAGVARVLQSSPLPDTLTVEEVLELAAGRTGAAEQVAARYGFGDALAQTVTELSTGMRRILDLTVTMQQPHDVLLLDEPSSGVAEAELPHLVELVRQHRVRSGATIVLVEHRPELVHQLADQVLELRTPGPMVRGTPAGDVGPAQVDDVLSGVAAAGRPAPAPPRRTVSTWTKLRLGLRELAAGMSSVLALGVLNRVMKVELGITLVAVAALLASYNLAAPVALAIGHRSDRVPVLGRHRSPYIIGGACVSALALAVAPHVADRLAGGLRPVPVALLLGLFLLTIASVWGLDRHHPDPDELDAPTTAWQAVREVAALRSSGASSRSPHAPPAPDAGGADLRRPRRPPRRGDRGLPGAVGRADRGADALVAARPAGPRAVR